MKKKGKRFTEALGLILLYFRNNREVFKMYILQYIYIRIYLYVLLNDARCPCSEYYYSRKIVLETKISLTRFRENKKIK